MPLFATAADLLIEPIEGGLTNANYRVRAGGNRYFVRVAGSNTAALGIDRTAERNANANAAAAGIAPDVIYFNPRNGVLVTRFLDGHVPTVEEAQTPAGIDRLAETLKRIHALPPNGARYCPFAKARAWADTARLHQACFPDDFEQLAGRMRAVEVDRPLPPEPCFCHNDLVRGNLIDVGGGTLFVLDWEYAGIGEPMFDLAVLCMNCRFGPEHEDRLLAGYFGTFGDAHRAYLRRFKLAFDYHMGVWYLLQSRVSPLDLPFPRGAAHHFGRLRENLEKV